MNTRVVGIGVVALLLCGIAALFPPFEDPAITEAGPTYAVVWHPPAGANPGSVKEIDRAVLQGEWMLLCLPAIGLVAANWRKPLFTRGQSIFLWIGILVAMLRILFPPEYGGGSLGLHVGVGILFHHAEEAFIDLPSIDNHLLGIGIVTVGLMLLIDHVRARRVRKLNL